MLLAIEEAKKAEGFAHPNPQVGAVIVAADGKTVLAKGYHHKCGDLHAERDAFKNAAKKKLDLTGASIYVTLEPCCHFGKQPPCTQAIIESGIKTVVIGSRDPNPLVNGKGVKLLEEAGITVIQDFMKAECDAVNRIFFHYIQTKTPYVILKYAMSADGETSCAHGESKWVTGEKARENVHKCRANVMAVMTGINTVLKDDPMLNVRLDDNKVHFQPVRIVCDSNLRLPVNCQLVETANEIPVIAVCKNPESFSSESDMFLPARKKILEEKGVEVLYAETDADGKICMEKLLQVLGEKGIDSIFVESGGVLSGSLFFEKNLVNELHVYIAPKIFGNCDGELHSPVQKKGVNFPKDSVKLGKPEVEFFDEDILLKYFIKSEENKKSESMTTEAAEENKKSSDIQEKKAE